MKITKISDGLKETDVLEGTINGEGEDEWIFLSPHSPLCLNETKRKLIESGNHFQSF